MVATTGRIAFILEEYRVVVSESAQNETRYGNRARRNDELVPTAIEDTGDAQSIADDRLELLGSARRSFSMTAQSVSEALALPRGCTALCVDPQKGVNMNALVMGVEIDFGDQSATLDVWG